MADDRALSVASEHILPVWKYALVFVALLALTALTVGAAFVDLGASNNVVAMAIACLKATLVVFYFMHVRYSSRLIPLVVVAGLFALTLLVAGSLADSLARGWLG